MLLLWLPQMLICVANNSSPRYVDVQYYMATIYKEKTCCIFGIFSIGRGVSDVASWFPSIQKLRIPHPLHIIVFLSISEFHTSNSFHIVHSHFKLFGIIACLLYPFCREVCMTWRPCQAYVQRLQACTDTGSSWYPSQLDLGIWLHFECDTPNTI